MCMGMLLSAAFPRIVLVVVWIFTDWVDDAFGAWIIPLIGLIFLPWTVLIIAALFALTSSMLWSLIFGLLIGLALDGAMYAWAGYNRDKMGWSQYK